MQKILVFVALLGLLLAFVVILIGTSIGVDIYDCSYSSMGRERMEFRTVYYLKPLPSFHTPIYCPLVEGYSIWLSPPDFK